ncbi:MAG TPA: hypothetical protein VFO10_28440 [Oligoflexus sp.]|uniref:hypothetical protein n=1 Tax=Oligoflexus sp. TaxID=1971216 RepID=UPI002D7FC203|nr:hypothetical protein [Oligoflexus sp.]HET9241227.1 hypothetical protein [Oligoflexus sp.]
MLKKLSIRTLFLMLFLSASPLLSQDLDHESSLLLRFTGPEAQKLTNFMKERVRYQADFDQTRYYGDRMSLACRENADCYLWLSHKEWQMKRNASAAVISFTLPVQQNTWSGQVSITDATASGSNQIQFQLQDLYFPGTYAFTQPMICPRVQGEAGQPTFNGNGDCRLELSSSAKQGLPTSPSIQVIQNLDNIIVNFKGPWAKHLYASASTSEADPHDPQRLRAQIGPETYCWNLDPLEQEKFLNDAYVCQSNVKRKPGTALQFVSHGSLKVDKTFSLTLQPSFRQDILQEFDLVLRLQDRDWTITHCPNSAKNAGFGQCGLLYDMKLDAGLYPLGNSVQGVAVGWGIIKNELMD